jgi:hypothetical protein
MTTSEITKTHQMDYKILFNTESSGTMTCPFFHNVYGKLENLELNFKEFYKGTYLFAKYGIIDFFVESKSIKGAIKLAKNRLNNILKNGYPNKNDVVVFTGFKYDENNNKILFDLSLMENTHIANPFTKYSYKVKKGDLLKYDQDGDGWGFWYAVDKNGKIISDNLKGGIFTSYLSNGSIQKY